MAFQNGGREEGKRQGEEGKRQAMKERASEKFPLDWTGCGWWQRILTREGGPPCPPTLCQVSLDQLATSWPTGTSQHHMKRYCFAYCTVEGGGSIEPKVVCRTWIHEQSAGSVLMGRLSLVQNKKQASARTGAPARATARRRGGPSEYAYCSTKQQLFKCRTITLGWHNSFYTLHQRSQAVAHCMR